MNILHVPLLFNSSTWRLMNATYYSSNTIYYYVHRNIIR